MNYPRLSARFFSGLLTFIFTFSLSLPPNISQLNQQTIAPVTGVPVVQTLSLNHILAEDGIVITQEVRPEFGEILTPDALRFVASLQREFNAERKRLLLERDALQIMWDKGEFGKFLEETRGVREGDWVANDPNDLPSEPVLPEMQYRPVEITGPAQDPKMVINALNSAVVKKRTAEGVETDEEVPGSTQFMADFEDSNGQSFGKSRLRGQLNLKRANEGTLTYQDKRKNKDYKLNDKLATLLVRAGGLHLEEKHVLIDGEPVSASIFDFAMYLYHNHKALKEKGSAPYYYLPKLESYKEARWWNNVITAAEKSLDIPVGTIKVTVLLETLPQSFQVEEIIYELRNHMAGINAGRWDYIFSYIKKLRNHPDRVQPDRKLIGMSVRFMKAYVLNLIRATHKRGVHAMGGMSAFIPDNKDPENNTKAFGKVRDDKIMEFVERGHDGTWIAHPGLASLAREIADETFAGKPNQKDRQLSYTEVLKQLAEEGDEWFDPEKEYTAKEFEAIMEELLIEPVEGDITEAGVRENASVGVEYLANFMVGRGAVAINNLMEDLATAEISRSQLWQWIRHSARTTSGIRITPQYVRTVIEEEMKKLQEKFGSQFPENVKKLRVAAEMFAIMVTDEEFDNFIPTTAYDLLDKFEKIAARQEGDGEPLMNPKEVAALKAEWETKPYWQDIERTYTAHQVLMLRGALEGGTQNHGFAREGARKLRQVIATDDDFIRTFGALNGAQAVQMIKGGLRGIYTSGWQTAAGNNMDNDVFPDQSVYQAASVPQVVDEYVKAFIRQSKIHNVEGARKDIDWVVPIVADAEAGFGGTLNQFELMRNMIKAGTAGVHFEDQVGAEKKCGHLGGKVLVPTKMFVETLNTARLAADVEGVDTVIIARTDADSAQLMMSDIDPYDKKLQVGIVGGQDTGEKYFNTVDFGWAKSLIKELPKGARAEEAHAKGVMTYDDAVKKGLEDQWVPLRDPHKGYWLVHGSVEGSIRRAIAYAPYSDLIWMETSHPNVDELREFTEGVRGYTPDGGKTFPFKDKMFAYNCSPSFNWLSKLTWEEITTFQEDIAALGVKWMFITLAGIHQTWHEAFLFAQKYRDEGMLAYVRDIQQPEFKSAPNGYTGAKHQREVGTGYFDKVANYVSGGMSQTTALADSTESAQFKAAAKAQQAVALSL